MRDCILHLADLHIGATVTEKLRELDVQTFDRFADSRHTFPARLADWIGQPNCRVGLVLIAGDLFHNHQPPTEAAAATRRDLAKIAAVVPLITVPGNHDEYSYADCIYRHDRATWPGILAAEPQPAEVWRGSLESGAQVAVTAATYEAGKSRPGTVVELPEAAAGHFCTAVLHGTASDRFSELVVEGERCFKVAHRQAAEAGYRYLALGHIHARSQWTTARCTAVYPGPPVGPSPSDPGAGTLTLAEPGASGAGLHLVDDPDLIGWQWDVHHLDVAPGEEPHELAQRIDGSLARQQRRVAVLELTGSVDRGGFETELQQLLLQAGRTVLVESRAVSLTPPPDLPVLLEEESLIGEFARMWKQWCIEERPDEPHANVVLREGLAAMRRSDGPQRPRRER